MLIVAICLIAAVCLSWFAVFPKDENCICCSGFLSLCLSLLVLA